MIPLILDIETFSLAEADQFIEEPTAPANYKDPAKIEAYIAEKRQENLARCALDVDLCQIVAIGISGVPGIHVELITSPDQEAAALTWWWGEQKHYDALCGYNILGFDLPVLIRRSQYLGVPVPYLNLDRYRTPHIDLMERLAFNGKLKYRSLDFYSRRFGITVPDATKGKNIDALVKAEDWTGVADHCRADLEKTKQLAERLGIIRRQEAVLTA